MKPLLIVKLKTILPNNAKKELMDTIAEGIRQGALILDEGCEIIAFDSDGQLSYPPREVTP